MAASTRARIARTVSSAVLAVGLLGTAVPLAFAVDPVINGPDTLNGVVGDTTTLLGTYSVDTSTVVRKWYGHSYLRLVVRGNDVDVYADTDAVAGEFTFDIVAEYRDESSNTLEISKPVTLTLTVPDTTAPGLEDSAARTLAVAPTTSAIAEFLSDDPTTIWSVETRTGTAVGATFIMTEDDGGRLGRLSMGTPAPMGTYLLRVVAADPAGNRSTVDVTVIVTDNPVVTAPTELDVLVGTTAIGRFTANEAVTWSVTAGASHSSGDSQAAFAIDAAGNLTMSDTATAGSYTVEVTATDTSSNATATTITVVVWWPVPTVTGITPSTGSTLGGETVTVTGTGFRAGAAVTIDGNACTDVSIESATELTCVTPAGTGSNRTVKVTNSDSQYGSKSGAFTFVAPTVTPAAPTVTGASPSSNGNGNTGSIAGGGTIYVFGTGFLTGATVMLGNATCTSVIVTSSTTLTCTSGPSTEGFVAVTVTNPGGAFGSRDGGFYYMDDIPPVITAPSDLTVTAGDTEVGVFTADESIYGWRVGGTDAALFSMSSTGRLTFVSPAVVGSYTITVRAEANDETSSQTSVTVTVQAAQQTPSTPSTPSAPVAPAAPVTPSAPVAPPAPVTPPRKAPKMEIVREANGLLRVNATADGDGGTRIETKADRDIAVRVQDQRIVVDSDTFSGRVNVTITVTDDAGLSASETAEVVVPPTTPSRVAAFVSTVLNRTRPNALYTPTTQVTWQASPNATSYRVVVNGEIVGTTANTAFAVPALVGPSAAIEIVPLGNDETVGAPVAGAVASAPVPVGRVNFAAGLAKLTSAAKRQLDALAATVVASGFTRISLAGHTDNVGRTNNKLALDRAKAARAYLLSKLAGTGVTVTTKAFAESRPLVSNATNAGKALNRRVDIVVA